MSSSSSPKALSSETTPVSISPTSPRSFVRTLWRAESENSAIFFCTPPPYSRMAFVSLRSIFPTNSSTCFFSASESTFSSGFAIIASPVSSALSALMSGASGVVPNSRLIPVDTFAAASLMLLSAIPVTSCIFSLKILF